MISVGDLFCGAGGSSEGLRRACAQLDVSYRLTAVNHWDVAIATHTANHPDAKHLCADVDQLRARELADDGRLDILWASPSCTEHSYAKGGHDVDDQNRVSAWAVVRETERYRPRVVIVENVPPFRNWGPVHEGADGRVRPIKSRRGETFRAWFAAMEALGYTGKWDLLNSADYGAAQTRIRFFAIFTAPGVDVDIPKPTHGKPGTLEVEAGLRRPWVGAREIIDWSLAGTSIFERDRPLSPNTMRRIEEGIRRYCPGVADAFLVVLRNHADAQSIDDPAPTIVASGGHVGLAETALTPFVCANRTHNAPVSADDPAPVVTTAHGGGLFIAEPFILGQHGGSVARSVEEPMPTVTQDGYVRVFEPHLIDVRHGSEDVRVQSLDEPTSTLTSKNGLGIVEPFLTSYYGESNGAMHAPRTVGDPVPTITTANRFGLVEPYLAAHFGERDGQAPRTKSIDEPTWTVTHRGAGDLVEPVIVPADERAPRGRVVIIDGRRYLLDVRFRMLQPHELSRAQGFPPGYHFTGTKSDQTAQVGNAVQVDVAEALYAQALIGLGYGDRDDEAAA